MMRSLYWNFLRLAKHCGVFAVCRRLTAGQLRILCYHGATLRDEHGFRPMLFISGPVFARRLALLEKSRCPVLPLGEAVARLKQGSLPPAAAAITIDDGWYGTYSVMAPLLREKGFPATLYVSTYHIDKQVPVFGVALDYILWRAAPGVVDLSAISPGLAGHYDTALSADRDKLSDTLGAHARTLGSAEARTELLRRVAQRLGFDWARFESERIARFMTWKELDDIQASGIDLQLHTHRHRFGLDDADAARAEIEDNRRALQQVARSELVHFCYPSGHYTRNDLQYLQELGIASATTTKAGFNQAATPVLELRRFLDADDIPEIVFEAELSGLLELMRRARNALRGR